MREAFLELGRLREKGWVRLRSGGEADDRRRYVWHEVENANAQAREEPSAATSSVQVIRDNERPGEKDEGMEVKRWKVAARPPVDADPAN
jgi:hypothetical protein